jgi:hypothetical protein
MDDMGLGFRVYVNRKKKKKTLFHPIVNHSGQLCSNHSHASTYLVTTECFLILVLGNFEELVYGWFYEIYEMVSFGQFQKHFLSYGHPCTFQRQIQKNNYLISKFNYLTFKK